MQGHLVPDDAALGDFKLAIGFVSYIWSDAVTLLLPRVIRVPSIVGPPLPARSKLGGAPLEEGAP